MRQTTKEQALQIRKLRKQGIGYQTIGNTLGLSRDCVRDYCRHHGLQGFPRELEMNILERMKAGNACPYCGGTIKNPKVGRPRRFCSAECRIAYWGINRHRIEREKK